VIGPPDRSSSSTRLVIFDLGRVLVRICRDWQHACECADIALPTRAPSHVDKKRLQDLFHQAEVGAIDFDELAREAAPLMGLSPIQVQAISEAFIFGPYPGAAELLNELSQAGVRTACLSNTNEHHWGLLSEVGHRAFISLDRLDHRFASHLIRARKPDEEIYSHVESQTGLPGDAMLFFDDLPENVAAAERRGWNAQWIDPSLDEPIGQIREALRRQDVLR